MIKYKKWRDFIMKEKNTKGKELLKILQENYEIETAQDISSALKDMFKDALQEMMNAEFDASMGYSKYDKKSEKTNYRNGSTKKNLKSEFGSFEFETPRDRNGEFDPKIVPKSKRDVSGIEDKIISLYGRGLTTREINEQIQDLYGIEVSATMVSNITDQIIPEIKEWQERPLEDVYPFVFIDAVHFSVREDNRVVKKAAYVVLGIDSNGYKSVLGIYIGENESAKYWLGVLNDLKDRGIKDILIMCSDNLTGIKEAINAAFPNTVQQRCIVHMIRNSVKYVNYKDLKAFTSDLKLIYTSKNEKEAYEKLQEVKEKWKDKYASAFKIWESNWDAICPFFQFSADIRKIMYTTNTIESLNRQFRKYTKTKSVFPTDMSLLKCLYLSVQNIEKKWYVPYRNWGPILSELSIMFDGRI
jgi:transposase-like protein